MLRKGMEDYSTPCVVTVLDGSVVMTGHARMEGAFTPDAAEAMAHLLLVAATQARAATEPGQLAFRVH